MGRTRVHEISQFETSPGKVVRLLLGADAKETPNAGGFTPTQLAEASRRGDRPQPADCGSVCMKADSRDRK